MTDLLSFIVLSFLLVILPGPDYVILTNNTLKNGMASGLKTVLGTCSALAIHTFIAIIGLSAIIVNSAYLFTVFKYIGAAYLIYLGAMSLLSLRNNKGSMTKTSTKRETKASSFRLGFFTNLFNPKVAVFFLTFLPQFVDNSQNTFIPFTILGMIYILLTFLYFLVYILFINKINQFMQKESTQKAIQGISGVVLMAFGIKLALEKAHH